MLSCSFSSNLLGKRKFPVPGLVDVVSKIGRLLCFETSCLYLSWRSKSAKTFETSDYVYVGHHAIVQLVSGCDPSLFVLFCTRPRTFLASESFFVYSLQKYAKRQTTSIMTTLLDLIKSVAKYSKKESNAKRK